MGMVPGDKLPAISGVAREISDLAKVNYLAGLWKEDMFHGLLWSFDGDDFPSRLYTAPSWSWVSVTSDTSSSSFPHWYQNHSLRNRLRLWRMQPYFYANPMLLKTRHSEYDAEILDYEAVP